jgi:SAM-dependent methyltransferase
MTVSGPLHSLLRDHETPPAGEAEVAWYRARLPADTIILDAMCGTGRLLVPLVAAGLKVHGCDASASMIAACEARLAGASLTTPLFRQDVPTLNLPFRYGAALIADAAFQRLVDPGAARRALERIRAHLVPPALLFLELDVPGVAAHPPGAPAVEVRSRTLADGSRLTARTEIVVDPEARRIAIGSRLERRRGTTISDREDEAFALTWYEEDGIRECVAAAGFTQIEIEASPQPATAGERRFAVSARG